MLTILVCIGMKTSNYFTPKETLNSVSGRKWLDRHEQ